MTSGLTCRVAAYLNSSQLTTFLRANNMWKYAHLGLSYGNRGDSHDLWRCWMIISPSTCYRTGMQSERSASAGQSTVPSEAGIE